MPCELCEPYTGWLRLHFIQVWQNLDRKALGESLNGLQVVGVVIVLASTVWVQLR